MVKKWTNINGIKPQEMLRTFVNWTWTVLFLQNSLKTAFGRQVWRHRGRISHLMDGKVFPDTQPPITEKEYFQLNWRIPKCEKKNKIKLQRFSWNFWDVCVHLKKNAQQIQCLRARRIQIPKG